MYGQGSYAPQYRQGPPSATPPMYQQPPPGPPQYQQPPPGQPPVYQHGPLPPPPAPPAQAGMGHPFVHPPQPIIHGSGPIVHVASYGQPGSPYPPQPMQMQSHNAHHTPQPMPPRMLPPPPPPPLQGQVMYRTPHPPPPGIQHVMTPPPPAPSSYISITPAPFASFAPPGGDQLPPLPSSPPPLPPSPPPSLPLPPPPPALPAELPGIGPEEHPAAPVDNADAPARSTEDQDCGTQGEISNAGEYARLAEGQESRHMPSPPPRPAEDVVRNIEALCKFITKVGPTFETFARTKEAGNPHYAFLFGGTPGSAEAVGHEYFLWMKRNYQFVMKSQKDSLHNAPVTRPPEKAVSSQPTDMGDENAPASPVISDMDMEDDVSLDGDRGFDDLSKPSTREPISGSNKMDVFHEPQCSMKQPKSAVAVSVSDDARHDGRMEVGEVSKVSPREVISRSSMDVANEPLHAPDSTMEQLDSAVAVSGAISCSGSLPFPQDAEGDKDSPFIEDASLAEALPDSAECLLEYNVHGSEVTPPRESNLVNGLLTAVGGKIEEIPRVFVEDRGPFQSIQGYASDDSDEDNQKENAEDIIADKVSPKAGSNFEADNVSLTEIGELPTSSGQAVTAMVPKEAEYLTGSSQEKSTTPNIIFSSQFDPSDDKKLDDTIGLSELSQSSKIIEDGINDFDQVGKFSRVGGSKDTAMPDVDEFGRLVRKSSSDSDSDGMHHTERTGKRGRSWSRSRSPQETKWRRRSRSPRWRGKRSRSPRSPGPSRSNAFARRDQDQPPECFNFIRGRCFRGASCRYRHNDFGRHRIRQQQYQEYPHDSQNDDVHAVPVSEDSCMDKETCANECNNITEKEVNSPEMQVYKDLSEATIKTINDGEKHVSGSVLEVVEPPLYKDVSEIEVANQVSKEVISEMQEPQVEVANASVSCPTEEEKSRLLPDPGQILPADSLRIQLSVDKTQGLPSETSVQPNSGEGTSSHPSQPSSISASIPEQPQNVTQNDDAENQMFCPPVEALQPVTSPNQKLESQPSSSTAPVSAVYPNQSPIIQPFSSYAPTYQSSDHSHFPKDFPAPSLSTSGSNFQPSQLLPPPPPPPPPPHAHRPPVYPLDNTGHQSQRPLSHAFPSHGPPIISDYNPQKAPPSNPEWPNLPPPPPSYTNALPSRPSFPPSESHFLQVQQSFLPRTDFNPPMGPNRPGEQPRSQVADFYPFRSVELSYQHPVHHDEFRQMPLPVRNQQEQPFVRDGRFPHPQMPGPQIISDPQRDYHLRQQPFLHEDVRTLLPGTGPTHSDVMHPQSLPFQREPFPNRPYSIPEDSQPPRFLPREQFPNVRDFSHQPPYGHQHPANINVPLNLSASGMVDTSMTRYSSSFLESNLPPHLPYTGLPKSPISKHYNPYASTFEQTPTSFKFSPSVPERENHMNFNNRYESLVNPGHVPVGGLGSRITASPPNSRISSEQFMPRTGVFPPEALAEVLPNVQKLPGNDLAAGDAYDPLFDSIESSNAFKKVDLAKENTDVYENNRQKEETTTEPKSEAGELGEAGTDAEVGVVENGSPIQVDGKDWSPGIPADMGNTATGEIEIDQVRSPGKSKKNKDGRSMKLFKIALADFVKEVLKPSWRQGNLSKEAFKTIVKKTVEKVSGAMPSHQIPKSQVKINQFVESSQRKLTKLVMGYVDKYVKA